MHRVARNLWDLRMIEPIVLQEKPICLEEATSEEGVLLNIIRHRSFYSHVPQPAVWGAGNVRLYQNNTFDWRRR